MNTINATDALTFLGRLNGFLTLITVSPQKSSEFKINIYNGCGFGRIDAARKRRSLSTSLYENMYAISRLGLAFEAV